MIRLRTTAEDLANRAANPLIDAAYYGGKQHGLWIGALYGVAFGFLIHYFLARFL